MPNPSRASQALQNAQGIPTAIKPASSIIHPTEIGSGASHSGNIAPQTLQKRVGGEIEAQGTESPSIAKKARHSEKLDGEENENGDAVGASQRSYAHISSNGSTRFDHEPKAFADSQDGGPQDLVSLVSNLRILTFESPMT